MCAIVFFFHAIWYGGVKESQIESSQNEKPFKIQIGTMK